MTQPRHNPWAAGRLARWLPVLLPAIMLVGFALRVHDLAGQSMWSDEGLSVYRAGLPLTAVFSNTIVVDGVPTRDANPALYFLLLHGWRKLAGESIFALRFLGVSLAMLSLPLMYRLGQTALGRRTGLVAAALLAISPFHIWQTQELRNYGLLVTFNLLAIYSLFRLMRAPATWRRWLLVWAAAALAGVYTHYFGLLVFAGTGLMLLVWALASWPGRRPVQRWLWVGLGLSGLAALPLAWRAVTIFLAGRQIDFYHVPLAQVLQHAAGTFNVGISRTLYQPREWAIAGVALAGLGLILTWRRRRLTAVWLLLYQVIPLGLLLLLSTINPLYNGLRHLLIGLPPYLLFIAAAIGYRTGPAAAPGGRRWRPIWLLLITGLMVALVVRQALWLTAQFTDPELVRDDIRGAALYLNEHARAGDVIILHDTLIQFTFDYYYDGPAPVRAVPQFNQFDDAQVAAALVETAAAADRVWFLAEPTPRSGFSRDFVRRWLDEHWAPVYDRPYAWMWLRVRLRAYEPLPVRPALPATADRRDLAWQNGLQLAGLQVTDTAVPAGQDWWFHSFWRQQAVSETVQLSFRLVDEMGDVWAQIDTPLWTQFPPAAWPDGALVRYPQRVPLPAGVPPGQYQVWLRLTDLVNGQLIPAAGGEADQLIWPSLTVVSNPAATADRLPPHTSRSIDLGPVQLVGYQGLDGPQYRPGHLLPLELYWRVKERPSQPLTLAVQLVDDGGELIAEALTMPTHPAYPPERWQPGELLTGRARLTIHPETPTGAYQVRVGLRRADGRWLGARDRWLALPQSLLALQTIQINAWPLSTELPPVPVPLTATLGDPPLVELAGYDLPTRSVAAGESLPLTFFWRALAVIPQNYDVFVHLVAPGEAPEPILAQADGPTVDGVRPTMSWRPGEAFVDRHRLEIGPDVPPGHYRLWFGFYDPIGGQRPFTVVDGVHQPDGRIDLGEVVVEER